jgi:hypothetical protein
VNCAATVYRFNALKGIVRAKRTEYRGGILFAAVEVDGAAMKDLAGELEENAVLKRFRWRCRPPARAGSKRSRVQGSRFRFKVQNPEP